MDLYFAYGRSNRTIHLPDQLEIVRIVPKKQPKTGTNESIVRDALNNPRGTPKLPEILKKDALTLVIIPDKTRNARTDIVLPLLLNEIQKAGIRKKNIRFLFANGNHTGMSPSEKGNIMGAAVLRNGSFQEHDSRRSMVDFLGETTRGVPVRVNRLVQEAEYVIVVGTIVHHYFAGFGGGPKMIVPGVAACETITKNHKLAVMDETSTLHPNCRPGNVAGNPVYEDIEEAYRMVRVDFSVQVVLDEAHNIQAAFAGDTLQAHRAGRKIIETMNRVSIPKKYDCVIVGGGGFPKDSNLIQAHKAVYNAFQAVKPGGGLIIFAECADGIGSKTFLQWFDYPTLNSMKKAVMKNYTLNGNTALSLKEKLDQSTMYLISELDESVSRKIGFVPVPSFEKAWAKANSDFTIHSAAVLQNGDVTLPEVKVH